MTKKRIIIFSLLIVTIMLSFGVYKIFHKPTINNLINISKLSPKFMDSYQKKYSELNNDDKKNMLIIISSKKIKKEDYNAKDVIETPNNKYYLVFDDEIKKEDAINKLNDEPTVLSAEENHKYELFVNDNNNESSYNSWGIEATGLDYASNLVSDAPEVVVAILDTGLDVNLFNKYYQGKLKGTYNAMEDDDSMFDNIGHGTHIAGTIAEGTPDNVKVLPVKISDSMDMYETDILAGIEYITYNECADVINMSFGGSGYSDSQYQAIQAAYEKNIITVAAAGNDNSSDYFYPASYNNTISISSVDEDLTKSSFSNYGDKISFAAPGGLINSIMADYMKLSSDTDGDGDHETISGTSMAAPHASAAVAILRSLDNNLTMESVIELLSNNAVDLGILGYDYYYGYGLINFKNTLLCDTNMASCDSFNIFKVNQPTGMEINNIEFTHYNYGSINNILLSTVDFEEVDGNDYQKHLYELEDLTITGYDPYSIETQTITIGYDGLEITKEIKNPDNYQIGWEYNQIGDLYYLTGYIDGNDGLNILYFPEKINDVNIGGISDFSNAELNLFNGSEDIDNYNKIIIPESYASIGNYAFAGLPNVNIVYISGNNTDIGSYSFSNMESLVNVVGEIKLTENSSCAFKDDAFLRNISISNLTTIIPESAFENSGLTNLTLSNSLIEIKENAFKNSKLSEVNLPESLQVIGDYAFSWNKILSVTIPKNVNQIGLAPFSGNNIVDIVVDENNTTYDSRNYSNLIIETATNRIIQGSIHPIIPDSVRIIGEESFSNFTVPLNPNPSIPTIVALHEMLSFLDIPEGVTTIEENAFLNADYLFQINLPESLISIDESVFVNDSSGSRRDFGKTVLWVHENSYAHNYALENDCTYVIIDTVLAGFDERYYQFGGFELDVGERDYYDGETLEVNGLYYRYIDISAQDFTVIHVEVPQNEYTIRYKNGDTLKYGDTEFYVDLNIENGFQNATLTFNVCVNPKELDVPTINLLINEPLRDIATVHGENSAYGINIDGGILYFNESYLSFDASGDYTTTGYFIATEEGYSNKNGLNISIHVIDKRVVTKNVSIRPKMYDGTTYVDPDTVTLNGLDKNSYAVVSATLSNADYVGNEASVTVRIRLTDDMYENYAFSGDMQEAEWTTIMSVINLEIPEFTLLIGENFWDNGNEEGSFGSYNTISFEEAGDYNILGYYACNDGSCMIDDISIPVHVINKRIVTMWPQISPKTYDGTTNIDINTITMDTTMDSSRYSIISAELMSPDVTEWAGVNVRVRLNDDTYEEYAFSGNKQEENLLSIMKVIKGIPNYTIPTNLTGKIGQKLSDIILPSGFDWMDGNQTIDQEGKLTFKARYTPSDTNNYEIVENINITISVTTTEDNGFDYRINKYSVDETNKYISKIMVGTTSDNFKKNIELGEGYSVVVDSNNNILYTGGKTKIYKNQDVYAEYINIVIGDINGDGTINSADLLKIRQHLLGINILVGPFYIASDINYDGNINSADLLRVRQHLLGTKPIE